MWKSSVKPFLNLSLADTDGRSFEELGGLYEDAVPTKRRSKQWQPNAAL